MSSVVLGRRQTSSIVLYLALAFGGAWIFWLLAWLISKGRLHDLDLIIVLIIGAFAPLLGAVVGTLRDGGFRYAWNFFKRGLNPRMGWIVFLLSFFLVPLVAIAAEQIHAWTTHTPFAFTMGWGDVVPSYLWLFFLGGALCEEFGWSYLSDKLDAVMPLTRSTFVLGAIWALWHIPLFFIVAPGLAASWSPFHVFFVQTVAMRFLFAWTYHRSNYNILSNLLFHNASNMGYSIVALAPTAEDPSSDTLWYFMVMIVVCAATIWLVAPLKPKAPPED
jgi:hypothetical protein